MNVNPIPKATLGRLPKYLQYLKELPTSEAATVSATAIARGLSLGEVQVRKDLAAVSGAGKPKVGYERERLIDDIEAQLGYQRLTNAVLVGAGKLGRALLDYDGFAEFGVNIIAGFDCNDKALQIGKGTRVILPIKDIEAYCSENDVRLGIITVGMARPRRCATSLSQAELRQYGISPRARLTCRRESFSSKKIWHSLLLTLTVKSVNNF